MEDRFWDNASWSQAEKEYFYYQLHQLPNEQKAFYLNEKAERLLSAKRRNALLGVVEVTKEAIEGYPNKDELLRSYLLKAKALEMLHKIKAADESFQDALHWLGLISKDRLDAIADYLVFILRHRLKKHYPEVKNLCKLINDDIYRLIVHDFVMLAAKTICAYRVDRKRLYRTANEALKLVQIRKYQKDDDRVGLVDLKEHDFMINELLKIVR